MGHRMIEIKGNQARGGAVGPKGAGWYMNMRTVPVDGFEVGWEGAGFGWGGWVTGGVGLEVSAGGTAGYVGKGGSWKCGMKL